MKRKKIIEIRAEINGLQNIQQNKIINQELISEMVNKIYKHWNKGKIQFLENENGLYIQI